MPDKTSKYSDNASGRFYVDNQCIACELCVSTSPENFKMSSGGAYAYVYKQPENAEEEKLCADAMSTCPTNSIGDDGG